MFPFDRRTSITLFRLFRLLRLQKFVGIIEIWEYLAQGNAVTLMPYHAELTTQQSADLLNVSRPFLVKLLESGELAHRMVGKHRRVLLQDVMKYKENIDRARNETLNELVAQAQELNMGYE